LQENPTISIIGLVLMALVGLLVLAGIVFAVIWIVRGASGIRLGHATLACPHCATETPANLEACQTCGKELR
jgi:hypothetical protein